MQSSRFPWIVYHLWITSGSCSSWLFSFPWIHVSCYFNENQNCHIKWTNDYFILNNQPSVMALSILWHKTWKKRVKFSSAKISILFQNLILQIIEKPITRKNWKNWAAFFGCLQICFTEPGGWIGCFEKRMIYYIYWHENYFKNAVILGSQCS